MEDKYFANRGVERNKKPLKNIVYKVELSQHKFDPDDQQYERYRFKDLGYLVLYSWYEQKDPIRIWQGYITPEYLKELIGEKQYSKFCQGKRIFTVQRRIDGKNVSKNKAKETE